MQKQKRTNMEVKDWTKKVIKQAEIDKYLINGEDFIQEDKIFQELERQKNPDKQFVRDILKKSLEIHILSPAETAALLNVEDPELLEEMREAALEVKKRVYDNRIVFRFFVGGGKGIHGIGREYRVFYRLGGLRISRVRNSYRCFYAVIRGYFFLLGLFGAALYMVDPVAMMVTRISSSRAGSNAAPQIIFASG